jgi:hypothetical protein
MLHDLPEHAAALSRGRTADRGADRREKYDTDEETRFHRSPLCNWWALIVVTELERRLIRSLVCRSASLMRANQVAFAISWCLLSTHCGHYLCG